MDGARASSHRQIEKIQRHGGGRSFAIVAGVRLFFCLYWTLGMLVFARNISFPPLNGAISLQQ
jgi:hypothetical protein